MASSTKLPVVQAQNSFMKSMFFGEIREDLVFPYPKVKQDV